MNRIDRRKAVPRMRRRLSGLAFAVALALGAASAAAQTALDTTPPNDEVEDLNTGPTLASANLPTPLVFGDPAAFCLPGNATCAGASVPPDAGQPAAVALGAVDVAGCHIALRTGNVAVKSWLQLNGRLLEGPLALHDYGLAYLRSYVPGSVHFSVVTEVVALPDASAACRALDGGGQAWDLGALRWNGTVGAVGFGGAARQAALSLAGANPSATHFTLTLVGKTLRVYGGGAACDMPLIESGVYAANAPAGTVLFPVVAPAVGGAGSPAATSACLPPHA